MKGKFLVLVITGLIITSGLSISTSGKPYNGNNVLESTGIQLIVDPPLLEPLPIERKITIYDGVSALPVIENGENGTLHMAWNDNRILEHNQTLQHPSIFYKKSYDYGRTWTADAPLSQRQQTPINIDISVDGDNIAIVWEEGNNVYVLFSYDCGNSWDETLQISSVKEPSIALSGNNAFLVFKEKTPIGTSYVAGSKIALNPSSGTYQINDFNPTGGSQISSTATIDVIGNSLHVAIKDEANAQIYYYQSNSDGVFWIGGPILDSFGEDKPGYVEIAGNSDVLNIVWLDNRLGNYNVYMATSSNNGLTWSQEEQVSDSSGDISNIDIAIDSSSNTHICWEEISDNSSNIKYTRVNDEGGIGAETLITPSSSDAINPSVTSDSEDNCYLLWQSGTGDDTEIYFTSNIGEFDIQIREIMNYITNIPEVNFKNIEMKNELNSKFMTLRGQLQNSAYTGAMKKLENDIIKKFDGFLGEKSNNDWITNPLVQEELMNMVSNLVTSIEVMDSNNEAIGGSEWCDVGSSNDKIIQYGPSIYPNNEWGDPQIVDGRLCRRGYYNGYNTPNILLNLESDGEVNTDFRITLVYKASFPILIRQFNGWGGGGYHEVALMPANSAWITYTFETNCSFNYDLLSGYSGTNIIFDMLGIFYLSSISCIPIEYHCNVGEVDTRAPGFDRQDYIENHFPGVCDYANTEWSSPLIEDGRLCKLGTDECNMYLNGPDTEMEYRITITYKARYNTGDYGNIWQYDGRYYHSIGRYYCDDNWHTASFITDKRWYADYYGYAGTNVLFHFTKSLYIEKIVAKATRDYCNVGAVGDDVATRHEPGGSVYPATKERYNSGEISKWEWDLKTTKDGSSCRWGIAYSNIYLNDIDTSKDYQVKIRYKIPSGSNGKIRQWNGLKYNDIGVLVADNQWHTTDYVAKSFWGYDYNGFGHTFGQNMLLEFTKGLWISDIQIGQIEKYGLIVGGKDDHDANERGFNGIYDELIEFGWSHNQIYSYLWDKDNNDNYRVDGEASRENIEFAIINLGLNLCDDDYFIFTEIAHSNKGDDYNDGNFMIYSPITGGSKQMQFSHPVAGEKPLKALFDEHINEEYAISLMIFQSCFSGWATDIFSAPNTIVLTASGKSELSTSGVFHQDWAFIHGFYTSLKTPSNPKTIGYGFDEGYSSQLWDSLGMTHSQRDDIDGLSYYNYL